jgi:hypothetical protein
MNSDQKKPISMIHITIMKPVIWRLAAGGWRLA